MKTLTFLSLILFTACSTPGKYEPCAGKSCGDTCTQCAPDDANCFETEEVKVCGPDGMCSGSAAACGSTETGTDGDGDESGSESGGDADTGAYDPCDGKVCGEVCSSCPPDDPECVETGEEKACDPSGECVSNTGELCGDGDGDGDGTTGDGDGPCMPATMDGSSVDGDCMVDADCPAGYVCQGFVGFIFTQSCQIPCAQDCECPGTLSCVVVSDKSGSWMQCGT